MNEGPSRDRQFKRVFFAISNMFNVKSRETDAQAYKEREKRSRHIKRDRETGECFVRLENILNAGMNRLRWCLEK